MTQTAKRRRAPKAAPQKPKNPGGRPQRARDDAGLRAAIEVAGSVSRLAHAAGVTVGAVSLWQRIPRKAVEPIAQALKMAPHKLRPDLFDVAGRPIPQS